MVLVHLRLRIRSWWVVRAEPAVTRPIARDPIYRRRGFDAEIIELCVRWYISYRLSYRDLVELMADRGVAVSHTTIMRWVIRYVPEFEKRWNRFARPVGRSWRVDETYISVRGRWHYLYRAVDKQGKTVDFLLRPDRGIAAAQAFFRKALASHPRGLRKVTLGNRERRLNALRFLSFVVLALALPAHARDGVGLPLPNAIAIHAEPSAPHPARPAPVSAEFRG